MILDIIAFTGDGHNPELQSQCLARAHELLHKAGCGSLWQPVIDGVKRTLNDASMAANDTASHTSECASLDPSLASELSVQESGSNSGKTSRASTT